ncbi:hypothetical protein SAMN06265222_103233 [Neorhodopirellula lusitana]|uniref:Uncharacterized protein n=1 Tax=Neorhodopirellula lusitana TaxID=445327 RepID=A0ABY1PWC1_9BACT|nr:hypothetical protein [Neorhodopirellula lusitana]SMP51159.1 hypothetical protein SAMN06265222_103233 [Neorhodopirellula lusitana]
MRKSMTIFLATIALACSTSLLKASDDLFSEIAMESVFASSSASTKAKVADEPSDASPSESVGRVTSINTLFSIATRIDADAKQQSGSVQMNARQDGWRFPTEINVDIENDQLVFQLGLVTLDVKAAASSQTNKILLKLLSSGSPQKRAFFSFTPATNQLVIRGTLSNRNVTTARLSERLAELASLAAAHSDSWSQLKPGSSKKPATSPAPAPTAKPPAQSTAGFDISLIGTWSATPTSGEAYAIAFTAGSAGNTTGTFRLVHLKAGKSTTSVGNFQLNSQQLTLSSTGSSPLKSEIQATDADQFTMQIGTASVLFRRQK